MTPKQYLSSIKIYKERYRRAIEDVEQIRSLMTSAGAIRYDKLNIQSTPTDDAMARYVIKLEKAEKRAIRTADEYLEKFIEIRDQINMISPQLYSDILYLRYVHNMKLDDIADELNYDYGWIRIVHGKALTEFGKVFPEVLKN